MMKHCGASWGSHCCSEPYGHTGDLHRCLMGGGLYAEYLCSEFREDTHAIRFAGDGEWSHWSGKFWKMQVIPGLGAVTIGVNGV